MTAEPQSPSTTKARCTEEAPQTLQKGPSCNDFDEEALREELMNLPYKSLQKRAGFGSQRNSREDYCTKIIKRERTRVFGAYQGARVQAPRPIRDHVLDKWKCRAKDCSEAFEYHEQLQQHNRSKHESRDKHHKCFGEDRPDDISEVLKVTHCFDTCVVQHDGSMASASRQDIQAYKLPCHSHLQASVPCGHVVRNPPNTW